MMNSIPVRIITPAIAKLMTKDPKALPTPAFIVPAAAKLKQLHDDAVRHLSLNTTSVLDLHIHELPIAPSRLDLTLVETGLTSCLMDNVLTIYAVPRHASTTRSPEPPGRVGKNELYEAGAHWQPQILQSDRGVAMFLSSLRVFAHLLKNNSFPDEHRDRVVYVFDLLCSFPPAVRALHLLIQGRTISHLASAALSQAFYSILEDLGHEKLIKNDNTRLFEGARLVFGLIMEKANQLKPTSFVVPGYSSQIHKVQFQTPAPTFGNQLVPVGGLPSHPTTSMYVQPDAGSGEINLVLLSGSEESAIIFNRPDNLFACTQVLHEIVSPGDLRELHQLANLCGKDSLSVIRPSLLSSVAAEHLTFDSEGCVAVYTGKAGCAAPGEDTVIFRPLHGETTPNTGQIEQLLAPILQKYEQDGTNVFDVLGNSQTRALAEPDEIVMFAVDCSASMSSSTDLIGVDNTEYTVQKPDDDHISPHIFTKVKLEDTKKSLADHEAYEDILGCVVDSTNRNRPNVAGKMLTVLFGILTDELSKTRGERIYNQYQRYQNNLKVDKLELFAAGIKRFEQELIDMVILGAMSRPAKKWTWRINEPIPGRTQIPALPNDVTLIPATLKCPIKLDLIQDPVVAADGQVYGRQAISTWILHRRSSPLTGLMLEDTELTPDLELGEQADKWIQAEDLVEPEERPLNKRRRTTPHHNPIKFSSSSHQFSRALSPTTTLLDLYKVAFRGMRGRYNCFQLSFTEILQPSSDTISSLGITGGSVITVILPDDANTIPSGTESLSLIKIYSSYHVNEVCFWVPKDTRMSFTSVTFKWWRSLLVKQPWLEYKKYEIWTDLRDQGDSHFLGNIAKHHELLRQYLTPAHASGTLRDEPAYKVESKGPSDIEIDDSDEEQHDPKPLVLKIQLSPAVDHGKKQRSLSRLQVSKQLFEALINRIIAYSYKTHIGLVTFDSTAKVAQSITHVIENFRNSVNNMRATGNTALWDGLKLAQTEIMKHAEKYPQAQRRIICLSDGNDTKSVAGPADLCWQLRENKILVDSIIIGNDDNMDLKALSIMLKSYCFFPRDLTTALSICEMEPFLSQTERAPQEVTPSGLARTSRMDDFYMMRNRAAFTVVTQDVFPKRKEHPRLGDTFIQLSNCVRAGAGTQSSLPTLRASRILVEMREIAANPHPMYDCYVSESDMFFWKIVIEGVSLICCAMICTDY
jgi:Mg-chelatase subunit ChlD